MEPPMNETMTTLVLPLQGQLITLERIPNQIKREVAAEALLVFALWLRTKKCPVPKPIGFARWAAHEVRVAFAAGGTEWAQRQAKIAEHIYTSEGESGAALGLPIDQVCDYILLGQTRCDGGREIVVDSRDRISQELLETIGEAFLTLMGLDHRPVPSCRCDICRGFAVGSWTKVLMLKRGNELLARELYVEATKMGFPALLQPRPVRRDIPDWMEDEYE
jgi:hypothetical protein